MSSGFSYPAVLPSRRVGRPEVPEPAWAMVRLVEVVLKPGKRVCPPPSSAGALSGGQLSPGYAWAEAPGNFHHLTGLRLST